MHEQSGQLQEPPWLFRRWKECQPRAHTAPGVSSISTGGHRKGISQQREQPGEGTLNVRSALDIQSLLSRQEVPLKKQTGSETAAGLSQVRAGGAPGCWTARVHFLKFLNLLPSPMQRTFHTASPFTFHHPRSHYRSERLNNFPQSHIAMTPSKGMIPPPTRVFLTREVGAGVAWRGAGVPGKGLDKTSRTCAP